MKKTIFLRNFWYNLSSNQRAIILKLYYFPIDFFDKITGNTNKYVPPRGLIFTGSPAGAKQYIDQGIQQLGLLKKFIEMHPDDTILDVGCGVGRTAIALTNYLSKNGQYEGFDAVESGIKWCNSKIKKDYSNFNFIYKPIYNDLYNTSEIQASEFVFPYEDNSFDKVFLFSVFTHMKINEIQNYLNEIQRVLKPNGLCLVTFFTYNEITESYISTRNHFNFPINNEGFRYMNDKVKSSNIAISEKKLEEMILESKLSNHSLIDGFWKDEVRDENKDEFQDILVLKKV